MSSNQARTNQRKFSIIELRALQKQYERAVEGETNMDFMHILFHGLENIIKNLEELEGYRIIWGDK